VTKKPFDLILGEKGAERKISFIGGLILLVLTLAAGISVYVVMQRQAESTLTKSLETALQHSVRLFESQIDQRLAGARTAATRPFVIQNLQLLDTQPSHAKGRYDLQRIALSFLPTGFTGVSFYDARGNEVARAGLFSQKSELRVPLTATPPAFLLWDGQFILNVRMDVVDDQGHRIGMVMTEATLPLLTRVFADAAAIGKTGEIAVCAPWEKDMQCFLSRISGKQFKRLPRVMEGKALPMNHALEGKTGIIFTQDYRREPVAASYAPVGALGLGMVQKIDQAELYSPITGQLKVIVPLLAALVIAGMLLLRWLVTPLVRAVTSSRERVHTILDNAADGTITIDESGIIESFNLAAAHIFGYPDFEAIGSNVRMLMPEAYRSKHDEGIRNYLHTGVGNVIGRRAVEVQGQRKDGSVFPLELTLGEMLLDGKRLFIGSVRDITERKRYEEKLRLWERAIDSSVNAILITDATQPNNPLIYTNPAFERITGYRQGEALGRNCNFLQNEDHDQPDIEELRQAIREQCEGRAVLRNYRKDGSMFWNELLIAPVRDESGKVTHFVGIQNDVTERKNYEIQLEHQANYDTLTELPNRNLLQDRLSQALAYVRRHERGLAVLFIDLDYFKNINDSLGHNAGDRLLKQVAARLVGCVREGDTVSRQGGDEFVIVLSDIAAEEDVTLVTQKILKVMSDSFDAEGHQLYVTCSIGIALYPKDGEDAETLLKNADAALYRAKDLGRNNAQFYTAEMNVKALERLILENSLHHALDRNEFLLHYQPQVDLRTGEITGMEALVRWQHPELGLIPPARFIPVAEESGVIVPLGEWVLRTACAQNKAWQLAGLKPVCVAVNLSARQFKQQDMVEVVTRILKETELDSTYLELELTESLIMQNVEATIATLGRLKAMGIKLSIDDFGTGYSSLSYLKRFPIDTLKIDQSFVRNITTDPDDAAIVKTIISMAHDMQLRVIAEGVETEEQKSFLHLRHCDEIQGYFFSRPVPAEAFEALLREVRCLQMDETAAALSQRTLLLLDDEENILTSLTRLLRRDGYKILKATSASAAFDLLAEHPVGVIISDQRMPEMSGTEFLRRVKQIYPDTIRMVLSGYTDLKSVTDAINEGAVYKFLTKPWDDELLRANIQEAFQRYELVQDNQRLSDEMVSINEELNFAKRELEKRVEQKTSEAQHNVGVLQISQEMLEYLPVGVIGVGEDGLIAVANHKADELFDGEDEGPLVGCLASERLPAVMVECLAGASERRTQRLENGRNVIFWSHLMGASSGSEGRVLVIVPNEESGD
jgi:diguanylate cyclase (GGDEF)-like protein/PAS domain S-box-containing protein